MKKKGLSAVVATLMLVLLAIALVGILWGVISNLVSDKLGATQSCLDVFEKVTLNDQYTCYNRTSKETRFSISIANIEVDEVIVSISAEGQTKSLKITNENKTISNLKPYKGNYGENVTLPDKNAGLTYVYNMTGVGFSEEPDSIKIAPTIKGTQCDVSDSILEIWYC